MMKNTIAALIVIVHGISAFTIHPVGLATARPSLLVLNEYIPSGMTPEQWRKKKAKETEALSKKEFGRMGPKGFKSRSLQSFQEDLEKGKTGHLMPVMFAKDLVKKGKIKPQDVPYMQRGGSWDDSDIKGAKKKEWNNSDKKYKGKEELWKSTARSIGWSGATPRKGPGAAAAQEKVSPKPKTKKLFGLF